MTLFRRRGGHVVSGACAALIIMTCFNCLGYIVGAVFLVATVSSQALTILLFLERAPGNRHIQMFAGISPLSQALRLLTRSDRVWR